MTCLILDGDVEIKVIAVNVFFDKRPGWQYPDGGNFPCIGIGGGHPMRNFTIFKTVQEEHETQ